MLHFRVHQIGFKSRSTGNSNIMGMWTRIFGKKQPIETDNDKLAVEKVVEEQLEDQIKEVPTSYYSKEPKISPMPINLEKKPYKVIEPDEIDDYMKIKEEHDKKVIAENIEEVSEVIEEIATTTDKDWVLEEEADKLIKPYKKKKASDKAEPDPILGSKGSHLALKQRTVLREHLTHLKSEEKKMDTINIIQPPKGRGVSNGDVYIGKKHGYFRISMEVADKLGVEAGNYLVIANFGKDTLLVARKPKGEFGYELKAQQGTVKSKTEPSSLFCNNTSTLSKTGLALGNWFIDKHEPQIEDMQNGVTWLKLKHETQ